MPNKNCNPFGPECVENQTTFKEKKSEIRIESKDTIIAIKVDDCLITSNEVKKCDYLFLNCTKKDAIFIELKGMNLDEGINQIISTINILKSNLSDFSKKAIIIVSRYDKNEFKSSTLSKLQRQIESKIIIKSKTYTYR
jgi:hypothetical protein